ncbi:MAG: hypothetical protein AAGG68_19670 [Bacteroidota bacterium]
MNKTSTIQRNFLAFGLPFGILLTAVWITKTINFNVHPNMSLALTLDFIITAPLAYLLIAWRKNLPKFTAISFLILGIILASIILPKEQQTWLEVAKLALAPIELGVFSFLAWKTYQLIKQFRAEDTAHLDFLSTFSKVCQQVLGKNIYANLITYEVAFFYYGIIKWKRKPYHENAFAYHKKSGASIMYFAMLGLFVVEAFVVHILIARYNEFWAMIATGFSVYAIFQIIGHTKALAHRPILLEEENLIIRHGLAGDISIPYEQIKAITLDRRTPKEEKGVRQLAGGLQPHNVKLELKTTHQLNGIYGIKKDFRTLFFFVDEVELFIQEVERKLSAAIGKVS